MAYRKPIMKLARKISIESKTYTGINEKDPEYRILDPVVTDEMAEAAMGLKVRKSLTLEEVSRNCGKPLDVTKKLLWELTVVGVSKIIVQGGVDTYYLPIWAPGIMEQMVNNNANAEKYPDIGACFEEYTRRRTAILAPNVPVGMGLMRVIPIEQAISGETRRASYEEVSKYIEEAKVISVSDCSCRKSRRLMGEGCGHLEQDMCIQLDDGAENYIRTGRARQITKEEAYDIIRRAEENGLVHEIPNIEGPGKTAAICNCCSCSCFSLRMANLYRSPDFLRSNYAAQVDTEKCVACGQCVENCNVNALKLGQKLCGEPAAKKEPTPRDTPWGRDKWTPDFRTAKTDVMEGGTSPCKAECPAHIGVQGYIKFAAQGKYSEALELIKKENPFPAVCGRICPHNCESACTRGEVDEPVAIDEIKKFIADQDLNHDIRFVPKVMHEYGKTIAVIGAGPAGLSCAYYLAVEGYKVTVFEKQPVLGGMLTLGIPAFRLQKDVVEAEIDILRELGVEFKTGVEVGKDITINDLRSRGFEGFYIAIGAQGGRKLCISGEDAQGVASGVEFLREINLGHDLKLSGHVVVIGGGNVAMDVARSAVRLGAQSVSIYCLEKQEEMPALPEEQEEALAEGIAIHNSWGPESIDVKDGRVAGMAFKKCTAVFDKEGRFSPVYDENQTQYIPCNHVLVAIGQGIELGGLLNGCNVELNRNNTICADPFTYATGEADIFAGGDVVSGPKFAIDAIAAGKEGAVSLHRSVHPGQSLVIGRDRRDYRALNKEEIDLQSYDRMPRQRPAHIEVKMEAAFRDTRGTFTEEQVKRETERCLGCGATVADQNMCLGCGVCTTFCKFDAISLVKKYDAPGVPYEKMLGNALGNAVQRAGRIAVKTVSRPFTGKRD